MGRRSSGPPYDYTDVSRDASSADEAAGLLAAYDDSLPYVYGYLLSRCGRRWLAEDLTTDTFLAAADAVQSDRPAPLTRSWLVGIARHKLADHWRREARDAVRLQALRSAAREQVDDPWDAVLDRDVACATLQGLSPMHRLGLTLRYLRRSAGARGRRGNRPQRAGDRGAARSRPLGLPTRLPRPPTGGTPWLTR